MHTEIFEGYALLKNEEVPIHFEDNTIKMFFEHFGVNPSDVEDEPKNDLDDYDSNYIMIRKRGMISDYCLMHMELPLSSSDLVQFPHICSHKVDWYIDHFNSNAMYSEIRFCFEELSYFLPSVSKACCNENSVIFDRKADEVLAFDLEINGIETAVKMKTYCDAIIESTASATAKTMSELVFCFKPTNDADFFYTLFLLVTDVFSFICNRRNISLDTAELKGSFEFKGNNRSSIAQLYVFDKYKEPNEEPRVIVKTISYRYFGNQFCDLVKLLAGNFVEDGGTVSVMGIHPSKQHRNLIDLRQSISITSAFEHHARKYLPEIHSTTTTEVYEEIKAIIKTNYIENNTGEKRKKAKQIVYNLKPEISLSDIIKKAIGGYNNWESLELVFGEKYPDWESLADNVRNWRNELAHEKRTFIPTQDTIRAVRLVERLNYAIILREAGFSNEKIKQIVDIILDT